MKFFGEFLVEKKAISNANLLEALLTQIKFTPSVPQIVYEEKVLSVPQILQIMAVQTKMRAGFIEAAKELKLWGPEVQSKVEQLLAKKRKPVGQILIEQGSINGDVLSKLLDEFLGAWSPDIKSPETDKPPSALSPVPGPVLADCAIYLEAFTQSLYEEVINSSKVLGDTDEETMLESVLEKVHLLTSAARLSQAEKSRTLMSALEKYLRKGLTHPPFTQDPNFQPTVEEAWELAWKIRLSIDQAKTEFVADDGIIEKQYNLVLQKLCKKKVGVRVTKILSIDDSKAVHAFIRQCLTGKKVDLYDVFDGQQAIDQVINQQKSFDLILLDWEMPEIDGLATLRAFRSAKLKTPVIMLTSKNKVDDIALMLQEGAQEYVMKPFTEEILVDKIETILGLGIR